MYKQNRIFKDRSHMLAHCQLVLVVRNQDANELELLNASVQVRLAGIVRE
jgi:hypothetical protein